jgi:hypothetical protein
MAASVVLQATKYTAEAVLSLMPGLMHPNKKKLQIGRKSLANG